MPASSRSEVIPLGVAPLADAEFEVLRRLVFDLTGISLNSNKRVLLASRLAPRLRALHLDTFGEYHRYVTGTPQGRREVQEFINCITTNKTDFFREAHHFDFLRTTLVPAAIARAQHSGVRSLKIWSAGCSTGEEAWTLALTLHDALVNARGWNLEILATDIDTDVLATAQAGEYPAPRLEPVPASLRERHFERTVHGYRVKPHLRELVRFRRVNFMDAQWDVEGGLDAVLCRNVSIYFDRPTQTRVFERMCDLLVPEGHLIVGHSEVLHFMTHRLEPLHGSIYRLKPGAHATTRPAPTPTALPRRTPPPPAPADFAPPATSRIHVGELLVGGDGAIVSTVLGSCVAACLWDPVAKVGGMNHFLLPDGDQGAGAARYGVHAMELLINAIMKRGGDRRRLKAKIFGGGAVLDDESFDVGEGNARFAQHFLEREGIVVTGQQLGGREGREVRFQVSTGRAWVRPIPRSQVVKARAAPPSTTEPSIF